MTFNSKSFSGAPNEPDSVSFNTCLPDKFGTDDDSDKGYDAYRLAVHEAGHALGLTDIELDWSPKEDEANYFYMRLIDLQPYDIAHPTIPDAAMNYDDKTPSQVVEDPASFHEPDCSPHPFDILAVYAVYQHESSE